MSANTSPVIDLMVRSVADRIAAGELHTGSQLPSQADMAAAFATGRHAVRRAMEVLEQKGLVRGRQGSGYVAGRLIDCYVKSRTRYNDNVGPRGRNFIGSRADFPLAAVVA